jgi:hypothetical protein
VPGLFGGGRRGSGLGAAARIAAASLATRVPSKKRGFYVPPQLDCIGEGEGAEIAAVMWPSSISS